MLLASFLLSVVVGTWNGNWFPSGRAEHRALPDVEVATIAAAGKMLAAGIAKADPTGKEDVILSLCEIRNRKVAEELVKAIGRNDLKVASVSGYRRRDRFDQQQNVILTTLPVAEANWARWTYVAEANPPRGYAMAKVVLEPAVTAAVYSVHLKANYGATTAAIAADNRAKRTNAITSTCGLRKGTSMRSSRVTSMPTSGARSSPRRRSSRRWRARATRTSLSSCRRRDAARIRTSATATARSTMS